MTKVNSWRPKGWKVNPCDKCLGKVEDNYGLMCDLSCGKATAYANYEAGADALLKALWELASESPTGTFIIDSKICNIYREGEMDCLPSVNTGKIVRNGKII